MLHERRLSIRLMGAWWDRRGERAFPAPEDFSGDDLADIWPDCFTLVLDGGPKGSIFQHIGQGVATASNLTSPPIGLIDLTPGCLLSHAIEPMEKVLQGQVPAVFSGDYVAPDGTSFVYRSILLPTGREGTSIDSIIGGTRCKPHNPR